MRRDFNNDPVGMTTRILMTLGIAAALFFAVAGFAVALGFGITLNNDVNGLKHTLSEFTSASETALGEILDNTGKCVSENCAGVGTTCEMVSDCPTLNVLPDVTAVPTCSFGKCVWLLDPANFGMGSMPPLGPFADYLCKQALAPADPSNQCYSSVAIPDGDGVDGCIVFNGCGVVADDAFMVVVRSGLPFKADDQKRLRAESPFGKKVEASDESISVEERREMLRQGRKAL